MRLQLGGERSPSKIQPSTETTHVCSLTQGKEPAPSSGQPRSSTSTQRWEQPRSGTMNPICCRSEMLWLEMARNHMRLGKCVAGSIHWSYRQDNGDGTKYGDDRSLCQRCRRFAITVVTSLSVFYRKAALLCLFARRLLLNPFTLQTLTPACLSTQRF